MVSVFKALIKVVVIFNLVLVPVFKKKNLTGTSGENGINTWQECHGSPYGEVKGLHLLNHLKIKRLKIKRGYDDTFLMFSGFRMMEAGEQCRKNI